MSRSLDCFGTASAQAKSALNKPPSLGQESLLVGLGISDLVDQEADTTLGDDVRCTVANLNGDNRVCCIDSEHGEQVDNWVCAPADNSHELGCLDLALHDCIRLAVGGGGEANEEFVDNVQEEDHGKEPAHPARSEVTCDDELSIVAWPSESPRIIGNSENMN